MSNCRLFLVMLILNWSWIAFGSEQQCGKPVLVMDVYSVTVSSNDAQQHGFAFWTNELKKGPTSQKADSRVLHEEYPLGKPFGISEEAKDDRGHGNVAIAGRVETGKDDAFAVQHIKDKTAKRSEPTRLTQPTLNPNRAKPIATLSSVPAARLVNSRTWLRSPASLATNIVNASPNVTTSRWFIVPSDTI